MPFLRVPYSAWALRLLPLALLACSPDARNNDDPVAARAQNERRINEAVVTDKQAADADFLVKATGNALLQVELGKLAQARATSPVVKAYGASLVKNRLELLADLRSLAAAKQLAVPNALGPDEQAAYHEVSTQTGSALDKRLLALAVKLQKQDEDAFDDMQEEAYDGDIRGLAAKYLTPVRDQLRTVEEIADEVEDLP
jgi:putative membrane protein